MVQKEVSDHVRSWRFIILVILIAMTCLGSLYTAVGQMAKGPRADDPDGAFFFLKLFTLTDGTLPSFTVFISFLGPLLRSEERRVGKECRSRVSPSDEKKKQ